MSARFLRRCQAGKCRSDSLGTFFCGDLDKPEVGLRHGSDASTGRLGGNRIVEVETSFENGNTAAIKDPRTLGIATVTIRGEGSLGY